MTEHSRLRGSAAHKRRLALKALGGSALAGGLADKLPAAWQRPLVQSAVLPAHAQTSGGLGLTIYHETGAPLASTRLTYTMETNDSDEITAVTFRRDAQTSYVPAQSLFPVAYAQTNQLVLLEDVTLNFGPTGSDEDRTARGTLPLRYNNQIPCGVPVTLTLAPGRDSIASMETGETDCTGRQLRVRLVSDQTVFNTNALPPGETPPPIQTQGPQRPTAQTTAAPGASATTIAPTTITPTTTLPLTVVQFAQTALNPSERDMVNVEITKTGASSITFDMVLITADSNADNNDYTITPPGGSLTGLTIAATDTSLDIPLAISRDKFTEGDETLVFELQMPRDADPGNNVGIGTDGRLIITIMDIPTTVPAIIPAGERWFTWETTGTSGSTTYTATGEFRFVISNLANSGTVMAGELYYHMVTVTDGSQTRVADLIPTNGTVDSVAGTGKFHEFSMALTAPFALVHNTRISVTVSASSFVGLRSGAGNNWFIFLNHSAATSIDASAPTVTEKLTP